jgi:pseudomonalisin/xanthomonalisin
MENTINAFGDCSMNRKSTVAVNHRWQTLSLAALALCLAPAVQAESSWVNTQTQGFKFKPHLLSTELQAGVPVHIVVGLKLRNKAQMDDLATQMRHNLLNTAPLTPDQFMERFAPSATQAQGVVAHLKKAGFTHIQVAKNRLLVSADGTAGSVKTAFHTSLQQFRDGKRIVYANAGPAMVPSTLSNSVVAVLGLQNDKTVHTMARKATHHIARVGTGDASGIYGHNPMEFSKLYGGTKTPASDNATIGTIAEGDMTQTLADLKQFQTAHNLKVPVSTVVTGSAGDDTSGLAEWDMDSQAAIGAAGGTLKQLIFYVAPTLEDSDLAVDYNQAVIDNKASAINVSLGECETDASDVGASAVQDQIFETAMVQGQTFAVSSGDSGSDECGDGGNNQSYPAVSPYVVAVGGTTLAVDPGDNFMGESAWSGTGGGPSSTENAPNWQIKSGVLGTSTLRGVPDVAFDADPDSGAMVIVDQMPEQWGGTSLSAPIFTGIWARMQSNFTSANKAGFAGGWLYKFGSDKIPGVFKDVTTGNNGSFSAGTGWDYTTGWGSMDITKFQAAMINATNHHSH